MRTFLFLLLPAAVLTACIREPLFSGPARGTLEPGRTSRQDTADSTAALPPGEHLYLTAVRFPDGYDWDLDTCAAPGPVFLDLYCDGTLVRSVPAGASVHPDMHRFAGGHLYADFPTETETVLVRDGAELFRFEGRESLQGFLVREDGIHTLGQDRDGAGFTYRINGRAVYRSETGTVLGGTEGGALTEAGEDVFYTCTVPSDKGLEGRIMRNAECFRTLSDATYLLAFGLVDGRLCQVRKLTRRLVLTVDGEETGLVLRAGESVLWCRLTPWKGKVAALVCLSTTAGKRWFLQEAGSSARTDIEGPVAGLFSDGERLGWTVNGSDGCLEAVRWYGGETFSPGPGAFLASSRCLLLREGCCLLALTGRDGVPNRLWTGDQPQDLPFNGYFTSIVVE